MHRVITILFLILFYINPITGQELHTHQKDLPCLNKHYNIFAHAVYDSLRETHTQQSLKQAIENILL